MADDVNKDTSDVDLDSQLFPQNNTGGNEDSKDTAAEADKDAAPKDPAPEDKTPEHGKENQPDKEGEPKPAEATFDTAALNIPEGFEVDPGILAEFTDKAKTMNLSQAQAQELVDLQIKVGRAQMEQHIQARQAWVAELKADPEFGGTKFDATVEDARAVMRRFDKDGKVLEMLNDSGAGDNPYIIKMLANIKRSMSEDQFVDERGGNTSEKSLTERLWPDPLK